jgi:hypothetical protein
MGTSQHGQEMKRSSHHFRAIWLAGFMAVVVMLFGFGTGVGLTPDRIYATSASCFSWTAVPSPNDGLSNNVLLSVSAASPTEIWAGGYSTLDGVDRTLIVRWNGQSWTTVPSPNLHAQHNYVNAIVALSANNVWAVGSYGADVNVEPRPFIMNWNGQAWIQNLPVDSSLRGYAFFDISAQSPTDIWAVGQRDIVPLGNGRSMMMHYNGTAWQEVASSLGVSSALYGVTSTKSNGTWAVGYIDDRTNEGAGTRQLALRLSGNTFQVTNQPPRARRFSFLNAVEAIAPNDVWTVGETAGINTRGRVGTSVPLIQHWDGTYWIPVDAPTIGSETVLNSVVALAANDIWSAGYFVEGEMRRVLLMHYDGTSWTHYQTSGDAGLGAALYDVAATGRGELIAVGFSTVNGIRRTLIEKYADTCVSPTAAPTNTPLPPTSTSTPTVPVPTVQIPGSNSRQFPETGKSVAGIFLDYWDKNGGLAQQGYPISEVIGEISPLDRKPYTVQYFERAVFEYHPENQTPYDVLLSQLGTFRYKQKYPTGAPNQTVHNGPGVVLFPETGKHIGGRFLEYWQKNGGLAQQGYPISEEFEEKSDLNGKTYLVQYFERAVFELHPENQPPYDVLLSQLGTFRYKEIYSGR